MKSLLQHLKTRKLASFIENKTIYTSPYAELTIFKTNKVTKNIFLDFDALIIASIITGKAIMDFEKTMPFSFIPGETLIIPEENSVRIDFPEASELNPTVCLGLVIDPNKINDVISNFNGKTTLQRENNNWDFKKKAAHLNNNTEIDILVKKITDTFIKDTKSKDALLNLMIQELIIRLLQSKARKLILRKVNDNFSDARISYAVKYIQDNLTKSNLTLDKVAEKACMSKSHFFKKFKSTLGITPIDYINSEKIKFAKKLIKKSPNQNISDIAYKAGFNNVTYFNRLFKKNELLTPQQFKISLSKITAYNY
ncbi:helix-turn-helix domain-containing protein [Tenacibaculum finnmarkense]|uniref:helix-turn-helix domain-containing protein n=1 Tax=Tenacibaculum finnmarkense TaxID=2781243 RepID=UPI001E40D18B|nr:helix-turn-helix domain-containing protein [Tenacibaculum finnmarkense]MCD8445769.1 AraC family transcriptional regulator N-terminal domain-containing protein [Tenacibaculum finnmarkense genomovar finnmarkense]MCG8804059.1 helix-turn-helix domain-containing protein [Tenacibaculum finnmarkense]MCG8856201.1 helix-turn-helix domain-containing protein [Tenacibaculum finnmarkense]WCC44259.1 AraC family transcriptional regulator N-terminal domain-containing protein [Tenacibaculum finnmarkense]